MIPPTKTAIPTLLNTPMPLASLPSEFPREAPEPPGIELDLVPSTPPSQSPASIANSCSSTLSQSPSNISFISTATYSSNLRHTHHIMDPINVLSHPHESNPLVVGTPATSPADAAYKLQQLLKASNTDGAGGVDLSTEVLDDVGSVHSTGSSLRFAKGIVSGLFRGGGKNMATIPDGIIIDKWRSISLLQRIRGSK
ncbi:hypothetical protein L873DRAFT_652692 [Choiromyces venosus 120613-1]|uniref:Uncharacterized protein n=1 Tax=Choiromyces venosus 120613-1 TaxID=1336337 RepID=A0A3N4J6E2_9PEZI|nr:hypothetical protein L873DRAFT_652692 [Choiromyces venosus 120613-1]